MLSLKSSNVNEAKVAHNSHFNKFSWTNRKTVRARVARSLVALALTEHFSCCHVLYTPS